MEIDIFFRRIQKYLIFFFVAVLPVFVPVLTSSPYVLPRGFLLASVVILLIVFWFLGETLGKTEASFKLGRFDLPVLLLIVSYVLSAIIATPNKMDAFLLPGTASFIILGGLLYFLVNQIKDDEGRGLSFSFLVSGVLLSVCILATELGLLAKIPGIPEFFKGTAFNPLGGIIPSLIYLAGVIAVGVSSFAKEKDITKKAFVVASGALIILGFGLSARNLFKNGGVSANLMDYKSSWEVTIDSLKKYPLWGIGPGNYLTAFSSLRPVTFNQTNLWPVKFTTARNFYFTQITETGLIGLFALSIFLFSVYKFLSKGVNGNEAPLLTVLILMAVFPAAGAIIVAMFVLLSLAGSGHVKTISLGNRTSVLVAFLPFLISVVALAYFGFRGLSAEMNFQKAGISLGSNNAKAAYDHLNAALKANPKVDRYHLTYAQIDMAIANSVAGKKDITDNDKKLVTQLIQHAISEAKNGVSLNLQRSGNWQILASVYRAIMPFAKGADQFAVQTYSQAVVLDPIDPNLRINLGGTYYALGRYDEAIAAFKLAVLAKPDLANAHYNLAIAYREKKDFDNAIAEMNTVLSLVKKDSQDYTLAKNTLDELEKNKSAAKAATETENLTPPQPLEPSNIKPPIELPKEATPPANP